MSTVGLYARAQRGSSRIPDKEKVAGDVGRREDAMSVAATLSKTPPDPTNTSETHSQATPWSERLSVFKSALWLPGWRFEAGAATLSALTQALTARRGEINNRGKDEVRRCGVGCGIRQQNCGNKNQVWGNRQITSVFPACKR